MNIGIANGVDSLAAMRHGADEGVTRHARGEDGDWNANTLEAALREVIGDVPPARVRLQVALLPPFTTLRFIDLPPLGERDLQRVLQRDAQRHFTGREARVIAADRPQGASGKTRVVSAREGILEALDIAAQRVGVRSIAVRTAYDAWSAASPDGDVLIEHNETWVRLNTGAEGALRIRRAPASDTSWLEYLFEANDSGRVALIGTCAGAAQYLESRGYTLSRMDGEALEVAARNAIVARGPELIADAVHVRNARYARKRAGTLAAVGILLFVFAAGVDYWALGHRLAALRERRASIRDQVAPILALRDSLDETRARLELLEGIAPAGARFTDVVFDLAMHLPDDAYVTQLAGEADSVLVRGTAENAARAAEALRNARTLGSTQFVGAIRRELRVDAQPLEHFTLVARLRR